MTSDDFPFTTNAVLVEQPLYSFFAAAIPVRLLLKVAFSDAMEAQMKEDGSGYRVEATQRIIQSKRLTQIAGYIDREDSGFPNAIILAANFRQDGLIEEDGDPEDEAEGESPRLSRRWTVEADGTGSYRLTIPSADKLAAIIDGQHRLFAFAEAKVAARLNMNLLCSIFLDLPKPYQAQIFATINSNQKPVDKSLTYELFGYNIDEEPAELWSPDKLAVFLTRKLSVDLESPLRGRVSIAPLKDARLSELSQLGQWKVSTAVVVEGLLRLFSTNPKRDAQAMLTPSRSSRSSLKGGRVDRSPLRSYFVDGNDHLIYSLALNFLRACQNVFWSKAAEGSFIVKTVGIQALFDLLRKDLVVRALEEKDLRVDFFELHLSKASEIDFSSAPFREASGSGRTRIRQALERAIFLPAGQQ